jgi:hypothetical protein
MIATAPMPFDAAVRRLESKTPVASRLTTAEWEPIGLGLRDRAFFSARVEDIRTVAALQAKIRDALKLTRNGAFMDRSKFIAEMRVFLGAQPGDTGKLTDITSAKRLGLIYDFNVEDAMEYGRWLARQDPDIRDAFPCSELVRVEDRKVPRGFRQGADGALIAVPEESWPTRWEAAGGFFTGARLVALKGDPIWEKISRFGRPWPPFDFMSGMGLVDVSRDEATRLGVIDADTPAPAPDHLDFNHNLQASVPDADEATLEGFKDIFGDQVDMNPRDGKVIWQGQRVARLYDAALADPAVKWSVDLGVAQPPAIAAAKAIGVDLAGARLQLTASDIRHIDKKHGENEPRPDQRAVTSLDVQLLPHVWREPDAVLAGDVPGSLVFEKELLGRSVLVAYDRAAKEPKWSARTLFIREKQKGTP